MTAKALLTQYKALPVRERRKVDAYFVGLTAEQEDARDLAAARRALAEPGGNTDWEEQRATLPWNQKTSRQPAIV